MLKHEGSNPSWTAKLNEMGKLEKKRKKLEDRIKVMQDELRTSLTKKSSSTKEIDVPTHTRKIIDLKTKLNNL